MRTHKNTTKKRQIPKNVVSGFIAVHKNLKKSLKKRWRISENRHFLQINFKRLS